MFPKIHIFYNFRDGPWGGGNQFLKALRAELFVKGHYEPDIKKANIIIFNSHHFGDQLNSLDKLIKLKHERPDIRFLHRLDGPISLIRGGSDRIDKIVFEINSSIADGTVFQTKWSLQRSRELGFQISGRYKVIINAPNKNLFYFQNTKVGLTDKVKLINTSWMTNKRKGIDVLKFLDNHLDFSKFEMRFVGNVNFQFKNILTTPPQDSSSLAKILRTNDIFIAPSLNDPCSNAVCEALHSGLPVLARNSGGHPELVKSGGLLFNDESDILNKLDELVLKFDKFRQNISVLSLSEIADNYIDFSSKILNKKQNFQYLNVQKLKRNEKLYSFSQRFNKTNLNKLFTRKN